MAEHTTTATFTITMTPSDGLLPGTGRFELEKTWSGGIRGTSTGVMLSAGDPRTGAAGYVAIETVSGTLDGHAGSFSFAQLGNMDAAGQSLQYVVVNGSGDGELTGIAGDVTLTVDDDDTHTVTLRYTLPD